MEWKSEQINELATSLAKAQAGFKGAVADSDNPFFKSKYADLESVWEAIKEPLTSNGLAVTQLPVDEAEGQKITIMTILMHSSGQWISSRITLPAVKNDPQAYGSAYTYARRYALQAMMCIPTVDDDGEGAMQRNSPPKYTPPEKQAPAFEPRQMSDAQKRKLFAMMSEKSLSREDAKKFFDHVKPISGKDASEFIENFDARLAEFRALEPGSNG